ncbi:putative F-box protein At2g02030 [Brassica rapa]|uniref:F-box domain-containing protein n=2 Tax=Brassica TaxID=3705 RepID=A0A3P6AGJ7_BRACM|nr:putative F-box protein At2g02030 [Brassica napus]XP_033139844.1 putative F-box protein At2g02030 [Brassica rapa]XP_048600243.1 putative F-box protein At2g02030 [Brassica napus]CAF2143248.1 unnamed protein product [Brassica napus]CAG7895216.1 unnamed protein product [Brassica rapa]CDY49698.1 BnaA02g27370D [Brassica napus]VDC91572.1 unnamed protein product [Brassica rapa]
MEEQRGHEKDKIASSFSSERESKRGRREVTEIIINDDALEEIMLRLPVKSLISFQAVSKHWRRMITLNSFRERYMLHQKTLEPKFLCVYDDIDWYKASYALKEMRLEWSSACLVEVEEEEDYHISNDEQEDVIVSKSLDGLFCFYGRANFKNPIKVMNPSTRWSLTLPLARIQLVHSDNKVEFSQPGFGRDYVTGAYKLVWLHNIKDKNISSCEVFDFGVKEWRHVTSPPYHRIDHNQEATFANGWLYWFTHEKTKLIAFDLHMEMFQVVPNPIIDASSSSSSSSYISMHMCSLDYDRGLLNISVTNGDGMQHVWRVTNHNTGGVLLKTNKIFSFDLNKITSTWFEETHYKSSLLGLMVVSKKGNKVMLAKYGSDKLLLYQPLTPNSIMNRIFSYSPSRPSDDSVFLHYFPSLACPL